METAYFAQELEQIAARAEALKQQTAHPIVIAIDGMAGAGKTTLADRLARRLDAAVIHMDDFFLPQGFRTPERLRTPGGNVYYERFLREVAPYIRCGEPFAYRVYDAHSHTYTGRRIVPAKPYLLVEGSYSQHPEIGDLYDLRVFCKVSPSEQLRRIRERGPQRTEMFRAFWIPMENRYFQAFSPETACDFLVTSGPEEPAPPLEIERKFLIAYPDISQLDRQCAKKIEMEQTYLKGTGDGFSRRVRKSTADGVTSYRKNEKQRLNHTTRIEREESIEEAEYNILLGFADKNRRTIQKTRWCVPIAGGLTAEIDVFPFWTDRAICEVELPAEDTPVTLPDWLTVLRDVTEDPRYTNVSLAKEIPEDAI